jgi:hypothetical protein
LNKVKFVTRIMLEIDDDAHVAPMLDVLGGLSFVRAVRAIPDTSETFEQLVGRDDESRDFFAVVGIWRGRGVSKEGLRAAAWPERAG